MSQTQDNNLTSDPIEIRKQINLIYKPQEFMNRKRKKMPLKCFYNSFNSIPNILRHCILL